MTQLHTHIKTQILNNRIHPSQFEITDSELEHLEQIQDDLFDKLNNLGLTFIASNSDTILTHYIISKRIHPEITINEYIQLYTEIFTLIQS